MLLIQYILDWSKKKMTFSQFIYGIITYFCIGVPLMMGLFILCYIVFKLLSICIDKEFNEIFGDSDKRFYR